MTTKMSINNNILNWGSIEYWIYACGYACGYKYKNILRINKIDFTTTISNIEFIMLMCVLLQDKQQLIKLSQLLKVDCEMVLELVNTQDFWKLGNDCTCSSVKDSRHHYLCPVDKVLNNVLNFTRGPPERPKKQLWRYWAGMMQADCSSKSASNDLLAILDQYNVPTNVPTNVLTNVLLHYTEFIQLVFMEEIPYSLYWMVQPISPIPNSNRIILELVKSMDEISNCIDMMLLILRLPKILNVDNLLQILSLLYHTFIELNKKVTNQFEIGNFHSIMIAYLTNNLDTASHEDLIKIIIKHLPWLSREEIVAVVHMVRSSIPVVSSNEKYNLVMPI